MKAIGIISVVVGHLLTDSILLRWIYAFHMPLFMIISGFLVPDDFNQCSLPKLLGRVWRRLGIPYFVFGVLGLTHVCLMANTGAVVELPLQSVGRSAVGLIYGSDLLSGFPLEPNVLWFLPALAVGQVLLWLVLRIGSPMIQWMVAGIILMAGAATEGIPTPLSLGSGMIALPFLMVGYLLRRKNVLATLAVSPSLAVGCVLLLGGSIPAVLGYSMDMRSAAPGVQWITYPAAIALSFGVFCFVNHLRAPGVIRMLSGATLTIYALHPILGWGMYTLSRVLQIPFPGSPTSGLRVVCFTLVVVGLCLCVDPLIQAALKKVRGTPSKSVGSDSK